MPSNTFHVVGVLQHHFWLNYCASIILTCDTKQAVDHLHTLLLESLPFLNKDAVRPAPAAPNKAIQLDIEGKDLPSVKNLFASWGADPDAIDSCRHSIDHGDIFAMDVPAAA
jgi:hypothetical protein